MKATIVSMVPRTINRHMPGLHPEYYTIPAAEKDSIQVLVVNDTFFHMYRIEGEHIKVTEPGERVADAFVRDFINAQLGVSRDIDSPAVPGIFWLEGELTKDEVQKKHLSALTKARTMHNEWLLALVNMADDNWNKTKQRGSVSDVQRQACRVLGLDRDWCKDMTAIAQCPACGTNLPNPSVTKCAACQTVIDAKRHAELFKTA